MYRVVDSRGPGLTPATNSRPEASQRPASTPCLAIGVLWPQVALFFVTVAMVEGFFLFALFTSVVVNNFMRKRFEREGSAFLTDSQRRWHVPAITPDHTPPPAPPVIDGK